MDYVISRLKEPSTWRGIIMLVAGAFGLNMGAGMQEVVISAGVAISGVLGAVMPDKWK